MKIEESMADYYALRSREYERIYARPERQGDLRRLKEFVAARFAGRDVLEVACGTGYWTEILAGCARSVHAVDINEEVLEIARAKPACRGRVVFQKGDAYKLPEFSQVFDGGLGMFWWSHVPKTGLRKFLEQFHRFLAPSAMAVFVDNRYVEGSSTPISRQDSGGNTYQQRFLEDGSSHEVLKNFPSRQELEGAVAGLAAEVEINELEYYWSLSYRPLGGTQ